MIGELEVRHFSCYYYDYSNMYLTLQHPKSLRTAFLFHTKLNDLESYVNLRSVCYYDSNDEK